MATWEYNPNGSNSVTFTMGEDEYTTTSTSIDSKAQSFVDGLAELGISATVVDGVVQISGNATKIETEKPTLSDKPTVVNTKNSSNLINSIKESNTNTNSYLNQQNVILDNHSKIMQEHNELTRELISSIKASNAINASSSAQALDSINKISSSIGDLIAVTQMGNYLNESSVDNQISTNRKIVEGVANQTATNTKIVEGILSQTATNTKIVEGITSQTATNTKTNEHYDYQKEKNVTASDGTQYSPREIQAKSNAEHHLDKKGHNTMDWSAGFVDLLDDLEIEDGEETSLKNLLELLKTVPFEVINLHDDGKALFKREVVNG